MRESLRAKLIAEDERLCADARRTRWKTCFLFLKYYNDRKAVNDFHENRRAAQ